MLPTLLPFASQLPGPCQGAFVAIAPSGAITIYASTANHLWKLVNGVWVVFDTGTLVATQGRWYFSQFLNDTIVTDSLRINPPQISTNGGAFAPLTVTPPLAAIVQCVDVGGLGAFAFLFNFGGGGQPDAWGCSGIGNDTDWNFNIQTLGATARLATQPGPITGASELGTYMVAFKQRSIYLGQFLGGQFSWDFQIDDSAHGCGSHEAIVNLGNQLAFPSTDNFYTYSPGQTTAIPNLLRDWFFRTLDQNFIGNIVADYDLQNSVVYWYFPSINANPAGTRDTWIAWHILTNRWSKGLLNVEAVLSQVPPSFGLTWGGFGNGYLHPTYGSVMAGLEWGSPIFSGSPIQNRGVFLTDHILRAFTGPRGGLAFVKTGDHGTEERFTYISRARAKYALYPTAPMPPGARARLVTYTKNILGDRSTPDQDGEQQSDVAVSDQGWFDFRQSARYHRLKFKNFTDAEILAYSIQSDDAGER